MQEAPVRQDQDMLAVVGDRIGAGRVDDDRPIVPHRLLKPGVAVIPVGAVLTDRELVDEGLARPDAREADARHAIHLEGQQHAVPVDRSVLVQGVGHRQTGVLALAEAKQRRRQQAVDRHGVSRSATDREGRMSDGEVDGGADERRQIGPQARGPRLGPGRHQALQTQQAASDRSAAEKAAAIQSRARHDSSVLAQTISTSSSKARETGRSTVNTHEHARPLAANGPRRW